MIMGQVATMLFESFVTKDRYLGEFKACMQSSMVRRGWGGPNSIHRRRRRRTQATSPNPTQPNCVAPSLKKRKEKTKTPTNSDHKPSSAIKPNQLQTLSHTYTHTLSLSQHQNTTDLHHDLNQTITSQSTPSNQTDNKDRRKKISASAASEDSGCLLQFYGFSAYGYPNTARGMCVCVCVGWEVGHGGWG